MNIRFLFNTIKYLKTKQILYRIYYNLRKKYRNLIRFEHPLEKNSNGTLLKLNDFIYKRNSYREPNIFEFLNKEKKFKDFIDWNSKDYGKLWTYNLNYFDFLNQKNITKEEALRLIYDFINQINEIKDGLEPYPISLRGINWIKFLSKNNIENKKINDSLYAQYYILLDNLEYHLLGNHLLENGFSLLFGAYYFKDENLYKTAKKILMEELEEQILSDGGHFEQSPMYHQILLDRLLDNINLLKNNRWIKDELLEFLIHKAEYMLGWLEKITFSNGNIPLFNDSAFGIAPTTSELMEYAKRLGIEPKDIKLGESGYRLIKKGRYEIAIDVADVKASYIPGHTHADTFTFELYVDDKPIIVDTGVSTYEDNERRLYERSTKAHNTVKIENSNSSEVWGSFRLGERAAVIELKENDNYIEATHNGYYKKFDIYHKRKFTLNKDKILIEDKILGNTSIEAIFFLHLHPKVYIKMSNSKEILINNKILIKFDKKLEISDYYYAPEFNILIKGKLLKAPFKEGGLCEIKIIN